MSQFRALVEAMQTRCTPEDAAPQESDLVQMKFNRELLETIQEHAEEIANAAASILEVLPDDCTVHAEVDYFTPTVADIGYQSTAGRFPVCSIGSDVIALQVALDDLDAAAEVIYTGPIGSVQ